MPRASFIGHLSGILLGYPLTWRLLSPLTPPVLALVSALLIITREGLWPCQLGASGTATAAAASSSTSSSSSSLAAGPSASLARKGWSLAAVQMITGAISFFALSPAWCLVHLFTGVLGGLALSAVGKGGLPPTTPLRLLSVHTVVTAVVMVTDLLSLASALARARLYEHLGVTPTAMTGARVLLAVAAGVGALTGMAGLRMVGGGTRGFHVRSSFPVPLSQKLGVGGVTMDLTLKLKVSHE
jgi:hypothetical protein